MAPSWGCSIRLMSSPRKVVTADEMDKMTPQQRADLIDASVVRSLSLIHISEPTRPY